MNKNHLNPNNINSKEELIKFILDLRSDLIKNENDWENPTLERYLESMAGWIEDMDGCFKNRGESVPQNINWKIIGQILMAAKMYE